MSPYCLRSTLEDLRNVHIKAMSVSALLFVQRHTLRCASRIWIRVAAGCCSALALGQSHLKKFPEKIT